MQELSFIFDETCFPALPESQNMCMLCDHLNGKFDFSFRSNHTLDDCKRCHECYEWNFHDPLCKIVMEAKDAKAKEEEKIKNKKDENDEEARNEERKEERWKKEVAICKFWKNGQCKHGDFCSFRHSHDPLARSAKVESGNITCNRCGEFGHHIKNCPPCAKCGGKFHNEKSCKQCKQCEKWGHLEKNCNTCRECGDHDHFTSSCPYMKRN